MVLNIISRTAYFEKYFFGIIQKNPLMAGFFKKVLYNSAKEFMLFHMPVDTSILQVIQNLFAEFVSSDLYSLDVFLNYLQIFYAKVLRCPEETFLICRTGGGESPYTLFPAILQYIQGHYTELTLESLAEKFHYHPSYLSRMIRKHTGRTLVQILTELKLADAAGLLESSRLSVGEISEMAGYHSADYFTAMFKKKYGMSPKVYREKRVGKKKLQKD